MNATLSSTRHSTSWLGIALIGGLGAMAPACSAAPSGPSSTTQSSAADSCQTLLTPSSGGSITDASGNVWTLSSSGDVLENGSPVAGGGGTGALTYVTSTQTIWGQDASSGSWYSWNGSSWDGPSGTNPVGSNVCGQGGGGCGTGSSSGGGSGGGSSSGGSGSSSGGGGTGQFHVSGGQIIAPNGQTFLARGVNVYDSQMSSVSTDASGAPLTTVLPGIDIVRLNVFQYADPSAYQTFIDQLTSQGIVVELEDHTNGAGDAGGSAGTIYSGQQLTDELNWYAAVASAYASNPYVWFGTDNEPSENPSAAALSTWQQQTYDAIRGAGNGNIVLVEMNCNAANDPSACGAGYTASVYSGMTNIVWDMHYYGWLVNYSTDPNAIAQSIAQNAQASQAITSADGVVPVIIGEYGVSTDGQNTDPNGTQVVTAVESSGYGSMAWGWNPGQNDDVTDGSNNLTSYGQQVAQFIAQ